MIQVPSLTPNGCWYQRIIRRSKNWWGSSGDTVPQPHLAPSSDEGLQRRCRRFRCDLHDLRHAHASWLLTKGVPVLTVADRLGHDPAVLLKVYAHLMDAARNEPALAIARLLGD